MLIINYNVNEFSHFPPFLKTSLHTIFLNLVLIYNSTTWPFCNHVHLWNASLQFNFKQDYGIAIAIIHSQKQKQ